MVSLVVVVPVPCVLFVAVTVRLTFTTHAEIVVLKLTVVVALLMARAAIVMLLSVGSLKLGTVAAQKGLMMLLLRLVALRLDVVLVEGITARRRVALAEEGVDDSSLRLRRVAKR